MKNNKYTVLQEALADVQLIWDNCKLYNIEGSDIYKMASHCEKLVKKTSDKLFKATVNGSGAAATSSNSKDKGKSKSDAKTSGNKNTKDDNEDNEDYESDNENDEKNFLNLQEKMNLTDKIRKLANDGLATVNI